MLLVILDFFIAAICGFIIFCNLNLSLNRDNGVGAVVRDSGNNLLVSICIVVCIIYSGSFMIYALIGNFVGSLFGKENVVGPMAYVPTLLVGIFGIISKVFISRHKRNIKRARKQAVKNGAKAVGNGAVVAGKAVGKGVKAAAPVVGKGAVVAGKAVGKVAKPVVDPLLESAQTVAVAGAKAAGTAALVGAAVATGPVGIAVAGGTAAQIHHDKKVQNNIARVQMSTDARSKAIMEHAKRVGINTNNKSVEQVAEQAIKFASPATLAELPEDMDILDKAYVILGCDKEIELEPTTGQKLLEGSKEVADKVGQGVKKAASNPAVKEAAGDLALGVSGGVAGGLVAGPVGMAVGSVYGMAAGPMDRAVARKNNIKNNIRQTTLEQNPKWKFIVQRARQAGLPVVNREVVDVAKDVVKFADPIALKQLPKDMDVIDKAYYILGGEQNEREIIDVEAEVVEKPA